ncbi:hypothetical protein C8F01DRAFT_1113473 [Mycena amicta]|nr:hypothetical protein C8F01DRAFT_1113473 [Mycena amicta]
MFDAHKPTKRHPRFETPKSPTVVYWPPGIRPGNNTTAIDGFENFIERNPSGGTSAYVQVPHAAVHWLASNGDADWLQKARRNIGFSGPLPFQLAWGREALALFGSNADRRLVDTAQRLCRLADLPVVIRASDANPMSRYTCASHGMCVHSLSDGATGGQNGGAEDADGGGDGDGGRVEHRSRAWTDWSGPNHLGNLTIKIKGCNGTILVDTHSQIETNASRGGPDLDRHVKNFVRLSIRPQNPGYCLPDMSHSSLGFFADAAPSIYDVSSLLPEPDVVFKNIRTKAKTKALGLNTTMNFTPAGVVPSLGLSGQPTWGATHTVEATTTKAQMIKSRIGAPATMEGKDFKSVDFSYSPPNMEDSAHDGGLDVALVIGSQMLNEIYDKPAPLVSAVTRHQLLLWVKTADQQAPQGVLVFVNHVIGDVTASKATHWQGCVDVTLDDVPVKQPTIKSTSQPAHNAIALGVAVNASPRPTIINRALNKIKKSVQRVLPKKVKKCKVTTTSVAWLTPLYPSLDQRLQPSAGNGVVYRVEA